jgi:hypothetical protein
LNRDEIREVSISSPVPVTWFGKRDKQISKFLVWVVKDWHYLRDAEFLSRGEIFLPIVALILIGNIRDVFG